MTFWKTATKEQKLSQIDGGIECGMSARQVGLNLGAAKSTVQWFALENGRRFPMQKTISLQGREALRIAHSRAKSNDNMKINGAFDIFGAKESKWEMEL